jgi:hypothetical protein
MAKVQYMIDVESRDGMDSASYATTLSPQHAAELAHKACVEYPNHHVYVSFANMRNENNFGYLNPDGNHDVTGKNWNS